ncbi:cation:proton antiporter domain-containing protein [Candidatus Nitrospira bockiana]
MEQLTVQAVLGLIGVIILIGLGGEFLFKKTGMPSVLFLIALGVLLGPIAGLIHAQDAIDLAPYFGTLALLIILFDGGLNLSLMKVLNEAPMALLFTLAVFAATVVGVGAFYASVLGGPWLHGLLLGAILAGTTGAIVIPVVSRLPSVGEPVKVLLSLESAFTDVFVVVISLAVMGMLSQPGGGGKMISTVFHAFLDALLLAALAGVLWSRLLAWLQGQTLSYMLTFAAILVLYDIAELVGANGAITILMFGIVLGNMEMLVGRVAAPIRRLIGYQLNEAEFALDTFLKRLNEELAFLVRTFFYVLLGLIFDVSALTWMVAGSAAAIFGVVLAVRWIAVQVFAQTLCRWSATERRVILAMLPRGVAAAVMAFLPAASGVPGTEEFPLYALMVIALSVLYMTAVLALERRLASDVVMPLPATEASKP